MKKNLLIIFVVLITTVFSQNLYKYNKFFTNNVIFKLLPENKDKFLRKKFDNQQLIFILNNINYKKKFPNHKTINRKQLIKNKNLIDLSLIYEAIFESNKEALEFINLLKKEKLVSYAEIRPIDYLLYTPNDSAYTSQYYLNNLRILDAWNVYKGDTTTIIGIIDTGTDLNHEDLSENIYRNINDPIDGIDNDQDGYVDNYWGWDLGENDNYPQWESESAAITTQHGVWVSGCASAVADNGIGLAGVGYRTKIMPVKIANKNTSITMGYEGIIYAADHGCSFINCSWGSVVPTHFGQDIINYVTFNRNALVVSAAGNNGIELEFYPASYDNVLNVGASNINDRKWNNSNYAVTVDVMAPGDNVRMTAADNTYVNGWGTSFAAPMVAACAAIVKSYYDTLSALQVGEVIRMSCDNIDTIPENEAYAGFMGKGRVNLYRALTDELTPSVRLKNINFKYNNDTLKIYGNFVNYLKNTNNLNALLTKNSKYLEPVSVTKNIGILGENDTLNINNSPFIFIVDTALPVDTPLYFKIDYSDINYDDFQMFKLYLKSSFENIDTNNIKTTIANNGLISYTHKRKGIGYNYLNYKDICYEMGIITAIDTQTINDCVRNNNDFTGIGKAQRFNNNIIADQIITTKYLNKDTNKLNIEFSEKVMAWNKPKYEDFILIEYMIRNNTDSVINNFRFGLFADWDIINYSLNKVSTNENNKLVYTYSSNPDLYSGYQLLSDSIYYSYAIDNISGGEGGVDITDGFSNVEKYTVLTNNRLYAGINGAGNDVCQVLSCGPYDLQADDTIKIVYAIHSAENLQDLLQNTENAQQLYDSLYPKDVFIDNIIDKNSFIIFPNPANNFIIILSDKENINNIEIIDISGRTIINKKTKDTKYCKIDISKLSKSYYFIRINNKTYKFAKQ